MSSRSAFVSHQVHSGLPEYTHSALGVMGAPRYWPLANTSGMFMYAMVGEVAGVAGEVAALLPPAHDIHTAEL